ncbi:DUF7547 family protein [Halapricum hydrolyticum]|uniref:Uncharacterized protein n=1 Tax=Halapricum hydrolyticum TaxID=2979991 RepID=A0AAE3I8X9_9EURY|nr:hypothetical protein [Halapricum hydrolyticum]MCU4716913.1 hypothetical protein [Halapricum hydrolyticum]MCU4725482.1 hypothetical protein [Halapricum hydrolyticum]
MADDDPPDVEQQLAELTRTVAQLREQLERERRPLLAPRPPRADELRQFTSEVAIPGAILLLETNVRALRLLQRTIRLADGTDTQDGGESVSQRAERAGSKALSRLESALEDVQSALDSQPPDSEARDLLEDARRLQAEIEEQLGDGDEPVETGPSVDVESELQSIKDQVDNDDEQ